MRDVLILLHQVSSIYQILYHLYQPINTVTVITAAIITIAVVADQWDQEATLVRKVFPAKQAQLVQREIPEPPDHRVQLARPVPLV